MRDSNEGIVKLEEIEIVREMKKAIEDKSLNNANILHRLLMKQNNLSTDTFTELCLDCIDSSECWTLLDSFLRDNVVV